MIKRLTKPKKLPQTANDDHCAVFNLLCSDEYRHEKADKVHLKQNVANIQTVISKYPARAAYGEDRGEV